MDKNSIEVFELYLGALAVILVAVGVYRALLRRGIRNLGSWITANASLLALLAMGAVFLSAPHPLLSVGMDLAILLAYCCYASASLRIFGDPSRNLPWSLISIVFSLAGVSLSLASGNDKAFLAATAFAATIVILHAAILLLKRRASGLFRNGPGLLAAVFGLAAILQIFRALAALDYGGASSGVLVSVQLTIETSIGISLAVNAVLVIILMTKLEGRIEAKLEEGSREISELQILNDAFAGTAGLIDPVELFHKILDLIQERLRADAVVIYHEEREGEGLAMAAQRGLDEQCLAILSRPDPRASVAGIAFKDGRPLVRLVDSYEEGPLREALRGLGVGIIGGFPIAVGDSVIGVLTAGYRDSGALDPVRQALLGTLSTQLGTTFRAAILHAKLDRANARLSDLASTDVLTNLANRRAAFQALDRELARARRADSLVAVIMGDLDHFKGFNDRFGHDCGDYVLMNTAAIIAETFRATDIPSRWGGEEFLIVLGESEPEGAFKMAERLRQKIESSVWNYAGRALKVTITLGVALLPAASGSDAIIALADEALYQGKRKGRNKVTMLVADGQSGKAKQTVQVAIESGNAVLDEDNLEVLPLVEEVV